MPLKGYSKLFDTYPNSSATSRNIYLNTIKKGFENDGLLTKELSFQLDFNADIKKTEELIARLSALETKGYVKQSPYTNKESYQGWLRKFTVINQQKLKELHLQLLKSNKE